MTQAKTIITILTSPITFKQRFFDLIMSLKQALKKYILFPFPKYKAVTRQRYGGHPAVTRSIVEGLRKIGVPMVYDQKNESEITETVYVPGGSTALAYAIQLKKTGRIKTLIAGPNIAVMPSEIMSFKNFREIDLYILPSDWVLSWWKKLTPDFPIPQAVWAAGVDTAFWKSAQKPRSTKNIILYRKKVPENIFLACKQYLEQKDFEVKVITYGSYTRQDYLRALHNNAALIHLAESESQGVSLAEAWATDTPTIVWDPGMFTVNGVHYSGSSSAPYLTEQTGKTFANIEEFKRVIDSWDPSQYTPRAWVTDNMSDEATVRHFISILKSHGYY